MTPEGPVPVVADDRHRRHDPPFELNAGQPVAPVWERPARLDAIRTALAEAGHPVVAPRAFDDAPLLEVHDPDLVAFLHKGYAAWREAGGPEVMIADTFRHPRMGGGGRRSASPYAQLGWWCFDTATPLVAGSYDAARAAVDIALSAAAMVAEGAPAVYGLTRPPGHHAGADYFGGFCVFNHAAVAARWLTRGGRVTVLDLDVHHGNGTQDIFWRDPSVQYVSLHGDPDHLYPFFTGFAEEVGEGSGRGTTHNLPLGEGTGDDAYLDALDVALEAITAFEPTTLVVSLGLDTTAEDPIGSLALTAAAYPRIGAALAALGLPTVVLQEGGYAIDRLGPSAAALLAPLGG
ncbi:histone deacetylase family protein [Egicoccus sp. AB-alg6-2]|uniref:histone deacetylase family protein n=1 Tax=Egicoccus sp. AB-alg6-2 TaxID=3242692 RepID=UPI00359EF20B